MDRHVRVHHVDKDKDDPQLREVLAQRPEGGSRGRRRRVSDVSGCVFFFLLRVDFGSGMVFVWWLGFFFSLLLLAFRLLVSLVSTFLLFPPPV